MAMRSGLHPVGLIRTLKTDANFLKDVKLSGGHLVRAEEWDGDLQLVFTS